MDEMRPRPTGSNPAFTLLEILVVIAIMLVLATLALPAFNSITAGSKLDRAGQMVADQIALAHLSAMTKNRDVQVRVYKTGTGSGAGWRAIQVWGVETGSNAETPLTRKLSFPDGISLDTGHSPLLDNTRGGVPFTADCRGFRFRANGAADITYSSNYLTLVQGTATHNFYTVQVHPLTGKVSIYRP